MSEVLRIVQFPHPGPEHRPAGERMEWNRGDHARKFLVTNATYRDAKSQTYDGPIGFWGEWEPPSRVIAQHRAIESGGPRYIHEPIWSVPADDGWRQNTDPLVFGERFRYSNCRQGRNAKLRSLAPGSLVLFGSPLAGQFVLDTVFVVSSGVDYRVSEADDLSVDEDVHQAVFVPLGSRRPPTEGSRPMRLYEGALPGVDGAPFSFVPCIAWEDGSHGFARPALTIDARWVNPRNARAAKAVDATPEQVREVWEQVRDQVLDEGLVLGVGIPWPSPSAP